MDSNLNVKNNRLSPYFSRAGVWAFSIGTSIGWGSFVVTCNTYLFQAGILGTVLGLALGMAVILIINHNLCYMLERAPGAGGTHAAYHIRDAIKRVYAQKGIDIRKDLRERIPIALHEAAGDNHGLAATGLLQLAGAKNLGGSLFPRRFDEGTRVDEHDIRQVGMRRQLEARLAQMSGHDLQIDGIFGASKRDKSYGLQR